MKRALIAATLLASTLAVSTPAVAQAPAPKAPTGNSAWLAKVVVATEARSEIDGGRVVAKLGTRAKIYGGANQLLVLDSAERGDRLFVKVRLTSRPNDAAGWVNADNLVLHESPWRVDVNLTTKRVELRKNGKVVSSSKAVIGTKRTPTPEGVFAISESVPQPSGSKLGPMVIALTSHSNVHKTFDGGDGRVGLHGYEKLGSRLGTASSNGCIRLPKSFVAKLANSVEPGTPISVHR